MRQNNDTPESLRSAEAGVDEHLMKPVDLGALEALPRSQRANGR